MNNGLLPHHTPAHPALNRFLLPTQEYVTCVYWNGLYHITGTDIVRALVFRYVSLRSLYFTSFLLNIASQV
ncbi:hypothetical protein F5890DRAFT_1418024 [Lentinula detonsa]|uniref:STE-domain-containing protein n=1 Tax=Lentinula detonsa TaxID=2804962 RepID=A0AA38PT72_9AGAR|nr:hypothetical protein F5890DRAFT_1418024 [Lentinula detonsa]